MLDDESRGICDQCGQARARERKIETKETASAAQATWEAKKLVTAD